ncbi:hypothetical protein D9757_000137 [Collybiopsis confluens]|uniref:FYVE-type domain-containing protein n=1 Tax=Collybiopsis confluens TaxID=2823264 RepID=A0A8H5I1S4_9AGAR|nr:hypothetical protein D9757_000137 [Collybiopsis confluens]
MNDSPPLLPTIQEFGSSDNLSDRFVYTGESSPNGGEQLEDEEFIYPNTSHSPVTNGFPPSKSTSSTALPTQSHPSPAQLEASYAAAASGDLALLKKIFRTASHSGDIEAFSLANDASTRTGLTALHTTASKGYLDIVKWLVEGCGAIPDLEDKEGETALHKASLNGHLHIVKYLVPDRASAHTQDADGWTALHNACSKGYLDIVRYLCESGGAASEANGLPGVDIRSKGGWTPLMNAASKGHLPVVLYLLTKQAANPLIRNNWGETAYDAAAAVFEVWICEILQKAEVDRWSASVVPYNPLSVHTTVPLVLYENQRLDTRLKTLATFGGRPRFSASGLGRQGRRAPFELRLPPSDQQSGNEITPAWRSNVQLPLRDSPWTLPRPGSTHLEGAERSHFWLSDWTLDVTHTGVDAEEGWQYARHLDDPDDQWTADKPTQLERVLNTGMTLSPSLAGSSSRRASGTSSNRSPQGCWVRRRRWVRVMRRRLDIAPLPFLFPDGGMYLIDSDGGVIRYTDNPDHNSNTLSPEEGLELSALSATFFSPAQDYVGRARYLADSHDSSATEVLSAVEARRILAKLERATMELRLGISGDIDPERKTQAEVLLNAYNRELERQKASAEARGLVLTGEDVDFNDDEDDDDDDEEEFRYPSSPSASIRIPSRSSSSTGYFSNRPDSQRTMSELTLRQLSQAPDFRVPTHEAPQKVKRWTAPSPHQIHQWEKDEDVSNCRECQRRFNFIARRHCRRCGRIFCDKCSSHRALLDPSDIVHEPGNPATSINGEGSSRTVGVSSSSHRVCQNCFEEVTGSVPSGIQGIRATTMERVFVDLDQERQRLTIPNQSRRQSSSQLSDLAECPVCNTNLEHVGNAAEQEVHVKNCLDGGAGPTHQAAKYLVYKLPADSTLVGIECVPWWHDLVVSAASITPASPRGSNVERPALSMLVDPSMI